MMISRLLQNLSARWQRRQGAPGIGSSPTLEIQYHPSDIRKRVRYFFLSRRDVIHWASVLGIWVSIVGFGLAMAPSVIRSQIDRHSYERHLQERTWLGEQLAERIDQLRELEVENDRVALGMSKIYLAYGFDPDSLEGQGGYPFSAAAVPDSIFAPTIDTGVGIEARIREQQAVLEVFLNEVQSFETAHLDQVQKTPSISPLMGDDFVLTSPFAKRRNPFTKGVQFHSGIDLAAPVGTPIHASADGVVAYAGWYPLKRSAAWWRYGRLVAISHGDRFITLYGHCEELLVSTGDRVRQGDAIATVGNTGWSTSPHLHYEVRRRAEDGSLEPVDPRIYILDHRWRDEEQVLIRARQSPGENDYEPLPRLIGR